MSTLTQNKSLDFLKQNAIYFVLLILLIIIIAQDPSFLSLRNFSNILTQSSVRLIIALKEMIGAIESIYSIQFDKDIYTNLLNGMILHLRPAINPPARKLGIGIAA